MEKNLAVKAFLCVLAALSIIQMFLDYIYDERPVSNVIDSSKRPEYSIYVEVEDETLYLLQDGICVKKYDIASGKYGMPSPLGSWKIVEKALWGEGFGGRWMGFNVPWGKYGIHGSLPGDAMGVATSQGCIRMDNKDVAELYSIVPYGTTVVIVNGSFGPFGQAFARINPGDRGADVYTIQQRLKELGFFKGWVSGIYENDLESALQRFERAENLPVTKTITKQAWEAMGFREFQ